MRYELDHRIEEVWNNLKVDGYKGWDPYDMLLSPLIQNSPLKDHWFFRLLFIQLGKRSFINFRPLLAVPKDYNPKGVALIIQALSRLRNSSFSDPDTIAAIDREQRMLLEVLLSLKTELSNEAVGWGYNFDWQARNHFFFPRFTPSSVVTSYCSEALLLLAKDLPDLEPVCREHIVASANFVLNKLRRTNVKGGFLFSYSPIDGNNSVLNASLLACKVLLDAFTITGDDKYLLEVEAPVMAVVGLQNADGSWPYGLHQVQGWIDSFHTGYVLESLNNYTEVSGEGNLDSVIEKGADFYFSNFFGEDGTPYYYAGRRGVVDAHSPGQLFVVLSKLGLLGAKAELAEKVLNWLFESFYLGKGRFMYQRGRVVSNKIQYLRWSNAYLFNGLAHLRGSNFYGA